MKREMTAQNVIAFYREMESLGVQIWIDGGWGVDALLERQTRAHSDLDIVIQKKDLGTVVGFLSDHGFQKLPREDSRPWNFVMGDDDGKEVDLHVIVFDDSGNGLYGPPEAGDGMYPVDSLQWSGKISGRTVRCISPEFQILSHTGYEVSETDIKDVTALARQFDLDIPQDYQSRLPNLDR